MGNEIRMYIDNVSEQETLMRIIDEPEWVTDDSISFWDLALEC